MVKKAHKLVKTRLYKFLYLNSEKYMWGDFLLARNRYNNIKCSNMYNSTIKHLKTGVVYQNRKEAKQALGHNGYNRALSRGEFLFVKTYSPCDIII